MFVSRDAPAENPAKLQALLCLPFTSSQELQRRGLRGKTLVP